MLLMWVFRISIARFTLAHGKMSLPPSSGRSARGQPRRSITNLFHAEPLVDPLELGHENKRFSVNADVKRLVIRGISGGYS